MQTIITFDEKLAKNSLSVHSGRWQAIRERVKSLRADYPRPPSPFADRSSDARAIVRARSGVSRTNAFNILEIRDC
jgi:hypothetical protein